MSQQPSSEQERRSELRRLLIDAFSEDELQTLCFDLGIDYEELAGQKKSAKIRELITYCERHGRMGELIALCHREWLNIEWPGQSESTSAKSRSRSQPTRHRLKLVGTFVLVIGALVTIFFRQLAERCPAPMTGKINVAIADFGDTNGVSDSIYQDLKRESKNLFPEHGIDFVHIRQIRDISDAERMARCLNATIVLWGSDQGNKGIKSSFIIIDPQSGEEIADEFSLLPAADPEDIRHRTDISIVFINALTYLLQDNYSEASDQFERAITFLETFYPKEDDNVRRIKGIFFFYKGRSLEAAEEFDEALVAYQKAQELRPNYVRANIGIGNIAFSKALLQNPPDDIQLRKALAEYKQAQQIYRQGAPDLPPASSYVEAKAAFGIGNIYSVWAEVRRNNQQVFTDELKLSETHYQEALELYAKQQPPAPGGQLARVHDGLAILYRVAGRIPDAMDAYAACVCLAGTDQSLSAKKLGEECQAQLVSLTSKPTSQQRSD